MRYKEAEQLARSAARATRRPMGVATMKDGTQPDGWYVVADPPPGLKTYVVFDGAGVVAEPSDDERETAYLREMIR